MNEEEKRAIEYLKSRLCGNEGCNYIDVAQEDLRIFINLVNRKEKDIEGWEKYCEEIEEEKTEMNNKNCELEFEVEKLQKENEELKNNKSIVEKILHKGKGFTLQQTQYIWEHYIPKSKVKDKIEEIDKIYNDIPEDEGNFTKAILIKEKQALQELLEGRK